MEIVQTMNSDPGLAVGQYKRIVSHLILQMCVLNADAYLSLFVLCRLQSVQWGWFWRNIPREHTDRRWLRWLHLRLPGLLFLLRGDVETDGADVLAGCALQSRRWAGNTTQGVGGCSVSVPGVRVSVSLSNLMQLCITRRWSLRQALASICGTRCGTRETPLSRSVCCGKTPEMWAGKTRSPTDGSSSTDHRSDTSGTGTLWHHQL